MYHKNRIKDEHIKDVFRKHKDRNPKPRTPKISQHTHNALTNQKSIAAKFKDFKTEEAFSSQDQNLEETTNLCGQFFRTKIYHRANPLRQRPLNQQI